MNFGNTPTILTNKVVVMLIFIITLILDLHLIVFHVGFHNADLFEFLEVAINRIMAHPRKKLPQVSIYLGDFNVAIAMLR